MNKLLCILSAIALICFGLASALDLALAAEPTPPVAPQPKEPPPPLLWEATPGRFQIAQGSYVTKDGKVRPVTLRLDTITGRAWFLQDVDIVARHRDGRMGLTGSTKEGWTELAESLERIIDVE
jgi:hypothetical protein